MSPGLPDALVWVVGGPEEQARIVEATLRQSGQPLRAAWLADFDELADALGRSRPELLFCFEFLPGDRLAAAIALSAEQAPGLRVLSLGPVAGPAALLDALRLGAADRVSLDDDAALQHFEHVCRRELHAGRSDRELHTLRPRLDLLEAAHRQQLQQDFDASLQARAGVVSFVNEAFLELSGAPSPAALLGRPLAELLGADQAPRLREALRQLARSGEAMRLFDTTLVHASGAALPVQLELARSGAGGDELVEWKLRSTTAGRTQAGDRLALFRHLGVPTADPRPRAAVLLVVDDVATLETALGLEDAERLIAEVGQAATARLSGDDALFRFSTSEWLAIVQRDSIAGIEALARQLGQELAAPVYHAGRHQARITLTVCAYPLGAQESAVAAVDPLVREGRQRSAATPGQVAMLGETAHQNARQRDLAERADQLRAALADGRLRLAYQSIASLEGDARMHVDVLVRMVDTDGQERHAGEFIPAAEAAGLLGEVDRWVVARAIAVLAKREINPAPALLLLRLSEQTLREADDFLHWLPTALGPRRLLHRELCFAVPETAVQGQFGQAAKLAAALDALGAGFALDRFGANPQSAALLTQLPLRFVRFAPQLIRDFGEAGVQQRVADLVRAAKRQGVKTIVSHVEDANVMARIWQVGVDYVQGYYIQEPDVVLHATDASRR